jgi:hypothetical protein
MDRKVILDRIIRNDRIDICDFIELPRHPQFKMQCFGFGGKALPQGVRPRRQGRNPVIPENPVKKVTLEAGIQRCHSATAEKGLRFIH